MPNISQMPTQIATENLQTLARRRFPQIIPESIRLESPDPRTIRGDAKDGGSQTLIYFSLKPNLNVQPAMVAHTFRETMEEFAGFCTGEKAKPGINDNDYIIYSEAPAEEIALKTQRLSKDYKDPNTRVSLLTISDKMAGMIEKKLGVTLKKEGEEGEKNYAIKTNEENSRCDIEIPVSGEIAAAALQALATQLKNETCCDCEIKQRNQTVSIRCDGTLPREYLHGIVEALVPDIGRG